jgi:Family of unknown function (DUF6459)
MPSQPERYSPTSAVANTELCAAGRPAGHFRVRQAPDREPPFDDEAPSPRLALIGPRDQQLPFAARQPLPSRTRLASEADFFGRLPTARDDLPDPGGFARRFVIAVIEAATGRRTAGQLGSHTSPGVQAGLLRDAGRISRLGTAARPATLHSMRLTEPADGVVEAAATVRVGARYRAIAFRLEGLDGRWRCVRLQIG